MIFSRHTLARLSGALFALLIAVIVLPLSTAAPATAAAADTIHGLVNQVRWDAGQSGLIRNPEMDAVALAWAKQMAAKNSMSHNPSYSSQIPSGWNKAGENVANGYRTAQAMHDAGWDRRATKPTFWVHSPTSASRSTRVVEQRGECRFSLITLATPDLRFPRRQLLQRRRLRSRQRPHLRQKPNHQLRERQVLTRRTRPVQVTTRLMA
ncbi:CAP domain-containing protein [Salinibacterium sp. PAMC 21357]|uniref:CAP domain-containing protein n=1 Tax=Salinibacterium sp. PAMC 21357 TaxID=1112215 RepID=UPI0002D3A2B1|nr:CAP domain-containing protein [Salinibacterium sp. PAMC 21357]